MADSHCVYWQNQLAVDKSGHRAIGASAPQKRSKINWQNITLTENNTRTVRLAQRVNYSYDRPIGAPKGGGGQ